MDELLQLLKDANQLRREGEPQASLDRQIAELTHGRFASHAALSAAVREQGLADVAGRRQAQMAEDVGPGTMLETMASGPTIGLSPILGGLVDAAMHPNPQTAVPAFIQGREHAKARIDARRAQRPIGSAVEELGGALLGIPLNPLGPVTSALSRVFRVAPAVEGLAPSTWNLVRQGAAAAIPAGTVYGASQASDLSDVPMEALKGAGIAAPIGGGLGVAVPLGMTGAEILANRGRAFFQPQQEAQRQVMTRLARVLNPDAAEDVLSEVEHLRPGMGRLGDVNPIAYGTALRRTPNAETVAEELRTRAAGGGERLAQSAEASAGFQPGRAPNAILASEQGERGFNAISKRFYQPIEEANQAMDLAAYPRLADILQDERVAPIVKKVLRQPLDLDPMVPALGRRLSELPEATRRQLAPSFPTPKVPFTALQEIENELWRTADNLPAGSNFTKPQIQRAAGALREAMRENIDGFAQADDQWNAAIQIYGPKEQAGQTGLLGAFAQGAKARTLPPEQMRQQLARLTEEAQSAYRLGLLSDIASDLRGSREGVNAARLATTQGTQTLEPHLQEAFGTPQAMRRFLREAQVEDFFRRSQQAFSGGSQTAQRTEYGQTLFPNDKSRNVFARLLDQFKKDAVTIPEDQLAAGYQQALDTRGPQAMNILDQLRAIQAQEAQAGPRMQAIVRSLAPVAGGGGREAIGAAELAALMALINGTKSLTGAATDRGD